MKRLFFRCVFLSDVVINAHTATEGAAQSLSFIPGSNFLGIVAKHYQKFGDRSFDVFHSGRVRFGDAHPACGNERSHPFPAAWFHKKGEGFQERDQQGRVRLVKASIYLPFAMKEKRDELRRQGVQLKQISGGFFSADGTVVSARHSFSIKSAYNAEKRRAKDSQMYGYDALRSGSEWIFAVDSEDGTLLGEVAAFLPGVHRIGRSRTAQYGKVEISSLETAEHGECASDSLQDRKMLLYADSSLAFFDESGQPTFQPTPGQLRLPPGCEILWDRSSVRTRIFAPWHGMRKTRDSDRVGLDKGSVFAVLVPETFDVADYRRKVADGVGFYRSEGMGQLLVNPLFLQADQAGNPQIPVPATGVDAPTAGVPMPERHASAGERHADAEVLEWIDGRIERERRETSVLQEVGAFVKNNSRKFGSILASQWGALRALAYLHVEAPALRKALFDEKDGFFMHGRARKVWQPEELHTAIRNKMDEWDKRFGDPGLTRLALLNLCGEMAKKAKANNS